MPWLPARSVHDLLLSPEVLKPATASIRDTVAIEHVLRALKINKGDAADGFAKRWRRTGVRHRRNSPSYPAAAANKLDDIMKMRVNRDIAARPATLP